MVTKRRTGINGSSSAKTRQSHASGGARSKKFASKKGSLKTSPARTRTSLAGMTIYQPDLEPSAVGRKLLAALER